MAEAWKVWGEILGNRAGRTWTAPPANLPEGMMMGNHWRISNRVGGNIRIIFSIRITLGEPYFLWSHISALRKEPADLGGDFLHFLGVHRVEATWLAKSSAKVIFYFSFPDCWVLCLECHFHSRQWDFAPFFQLQNWTFQTQSSCLTRNISWWWSMTHC